jgi:hypothetical protein
VLSPVGASNRCPTFVSGLTLRPANKCLTPGLRPPGWRRPRLSCCPALEFEPGALRKRHTVRRLTDFSSNLSETARSPVGTPSEDLLSDGRPFHKAVVQLRHYEMWAGFLAPVHRTKVPGSSLPHCWGPPSLQSNRPNNATDRLLLRPATAGALGRACAPQVHPAPTPASAGRVEQYLLHSR